MTAPQSIAAGCVAVAQGAEPGRLVILRMWARDRKAWWFLLTNAAGQCILELSGGRIVCPACRRKTDQVVLAETSAEMLIVFCKRCKREMTVKIENGNCQCLRLCLSARARA